MAENTFDAFQKARREEGALDLKVGDETIPLILRFHDVRKAAKNWQTYSSDAPFRVPVPSQEDLRSVRQLPIEVDPPQHKEYRAIVEPFFRRPTDPAYIAKIEALIDQHLDEAIARDSLDVANEFALPLQSKSLTLLLGVPIDHADLFISWGNDVLRVDPASASEELCDAYIEKQLDNAAENPGDDMFSALNAAQYQGRHLTREEKIGFANLVFAGGRDTIINFVTHTLAYLAQNRDAFERLRDEPDLVTSATEEFVRVFSPLTFLGRVCPHGAEIHGHKIAPNDRAGLCWLSANMDETVFKEPEQVKLDRRPNPHVAFGSGTHNCLGAPQARLIMRTLLTKLPQRVSELRILDSVASFEDWKVYRRQNGYKRLDMVFKGH